MSNIGVKDNTVCGCCSGCGECCTPLIPITKRELKGIKQFVKKNNISLKNRNRVDGFDGTCAFLDYNTKKCMIYSVRPFVCKDFLCNHSDWKARREFYSKRAYYNNWLNDKSPVATFDDLIYDNPELLIRLLCDMCKDSNGNVETINFINLLHRINREDILNSIEITEK